jgi:hypothetical protein
VPRTKKPAGTVADPRNGRRAEVGASSSLAKFSLPKRASGEPWRLETKRAWDALWADPVASVLTPVDRPVLLRWADSLDRAAWSLEEADKSPVAKGSMGQDVASPYYSIAGDALKVAQACEAQLGVGALNRARLGIAITTERISLDEMNARLRREDGPRRPDPRVVPGSVVG